MWRKFIEWRAEEIFLFIPSAGLCGLWQTIFSKLAIAVIPTSHVPLEDDFVFFQSKIEFIDRLPTPVFLSFPCGLAGKESTCNVGDLGSISGLRRSSGEGKGYAVQYSDLENAMDYAHEVVKSQTWLSDFHFLQSL